jgi:hypothetical protein
MMSKGPKKTPPKKGDTPSVGEMLKKASKLMGGEKSMKELMVPAKKAGGGAMKTKGYAKGGAMKTKGMAKGGKMRMRPPSGKKSGLYGR